MRFTKAFNEGLEKLVAEYREFIFDEARALVRSLRPAHKGDKAGLALLDQVDDLLRAASHKSVVR